MEKGSIGEVSGIDGYLFRLIATFEAAAMQQLGKIAHPLTGDVEVDLSGASDSIEMLSAIQRKTEGNLNADEKRLLDHVLYQLRMNYVDVAKEQGGSSGGAQEGGAADGSDSGPAGQNGQAAEPGGEAAGQDGEAAGPGGEAAQQNGEAAEPDGVEGEEDRS